MDTGLYDVIIADEYRTQLKIQELNRIADGSVITLSRRGLPPVLKTDRLPMIVMSNYTPQEAYHKAWAADEPGIKALMERFHVVYFDDREAIRITVEGSEPPVALINPAAMKAGFTSTRHTSAQLDSGCHRYVPVDEPLGWSDEEGPYNTIRRPSPTSPTTLT